MLIAATSATAAEASFNRQLIVTSLRRSCLWREQPGLSSVISGPGCPRTAQPAVWFAGTRDPSRPTKPRVPASGYTQDRAQAFTAGFVEATFVVMIEIYRYQLDNSAHLC